MVVLIVDDDSAIVHNLGEWLTQAGYSVCTAHTAARAIEIVNSQPIDFAIIDLMLPDRQGWHLVKTLRQQSSLPVIVISAITDLSRRVQLLTSGADDYLVKPFDPRELLARMEAIQRRLLPLTDDRSTEVTFGPYRVNLRDKTTVRGTDDVKLTPSEFTILQTLVTSPGRVYSRDQLLDKLHDAIADDAPTPRSIDVHIGTLRGKLEANPKRPRWIETVWGLGYRFRREDP